MSESFLNKLCNTLLFILILIIIVGAVLFSDWFTLIWSTVDWPLRIIGILIISISFSITLLYLIIIDIDNKRMK